MKEIDRALAKYFRDQHWVVDRPQVTRLGLTPTQVRRRLRSGEWEQIHRGVYRLAASARTLEQRLMAACMAAGPQAVASHDSAAWLWDLLPHPPEHATITVPTRQHPILAGVEVHRSHVDPARVSYRRGIACTDPLRGLVDLAAVADHSMLVAALDQALSTRLVSGKAMAAELERRQARGRRGVPPLRQLLSSRGVIGAPRASVLEREAMVLLDRWGIPVTGREIKAGPDDRYRLDFTLAPPVAMEVDGYTHHWSPESKARDEARRNQLRLDGVFLLVYCWIDLHADHRRVYRELTTAVARYGR
jgi:hypothetical protein